MPNKMVGAIFQNRELKILMTGENDAIDQVISIVLQKCIQGLKYSARLKVPKSRAKTKVRHFARLLLKIPCLFCLGVVIDGKHCVINCPTTSGSVFYSYKGSFSVVLTEISGATYTFTNVDTLQR